MARLVETSGEHPRSYVLRQHTTLGRSEDNIIAIADSAISAHHALIRQMPTGEFCIEDLETTNGTYVDGEKVRTKTLTHGSEICVGSILLRFAEEDEIREPTPTAPLHTISMTLSQELPEVQPLWEHPVEQSHDFGHAGDVGDGNLHANYEKLRAAYELIHSIVGEDQLDAILNRIVDTVIRQMSADRAAVLLVSQEGLLVPWVAKQRKESAEEFTVSTSILSYVMEHRSAVVCNDLGADNRFAGSKSIIIQNVRSAMCVPMLYDGSLVGVIHMDSQMGKTLYDKETLGLVTTVANTAAFAVKTAMLKNQIQQMERERAAAMGAMISGASHFINNPLAVLTANLGMLREWSATLTSFHQMANARSPEVGALYAQQEIDFIDEELGPLQTESAHAATRIGAIVAALHVFDHQHDSEERSVFDVVKVVHELVPEHQRAIESVARIHLQLMSAPIYGVRERIRLLLSNLLTNAQQAIRQGTPDTNWIVVSTYVSESRVVITVDDTGCGIPEEKRPLIFAPFYTDRMDGSLGLGLAVCAEIARQHGAQLRTQAREGGGTRVIVELPLAT